MFLLVFILTETCPLVTNLTGTDSVSGLDKMVSTGDPQLRGPHDQWLVLITPSDVSLGVHPHRDLFFCRKPLLDKMVSAGGPQWRGAQAQWLYKCSVRLLLMILSAPSDVSPGVFPHIDKSETYFLIVVTNPVSSRWSPPVVLSGAVLMISGSLSALTQSRCDSIGDFDGLFFGSALLGLKSLPRPLSRVWGLRARSWSLSRCAK